MQSSQNAKKTQQTKPKKGKPVEIPVPKKSEIDAAFKKIAKPKKP